MTPDPKRRETLIKTTAAAGGLALAAAAYPFLASLAPSERAKALGAPVIPPYKYVGEKRILIGADSA